MISERKNPQTLLAAIRHFDPETAERYIASIKWPDSEPCCPQCGSVNVGRVKSRRRYQCREKGCRKQFSLITGTIMEGTHLRLDQWVAAVWQLVNCRNGISSCELARSIGCKQQSAWHLIHRIRHILQQHHSDRFADPCEADTTYVGGLFKFMSPERLKRAKKRMNWNKSIVHAIKNRRTGRVRACVIEADAMAPVKREVLGNVEPGSRLYTDSGSSYRWAKSDYEHRTVNHKIEYVRDDAYTNGCENFFNCLRRACKGTYIKPTAEHLPAYVDEAAFRFNVRDLSEWERFDAAMRLIVGKRLTYSELTDGAIR